VDKDCDLEPSESAETYVKRKYGGKVPEYEEIKETIAAVKEELK
jgi:hypothetical protein